MRAMLPVSNSTSMPSRRIARLSSERCFSSNRQDEAKRLLPRATSAYPLGKHSQARSITPTSDGFHLFGLTIHTISFPLPSVRRSETPEQIHDPQAVLR